MPLLLSAVWRLRRDARLLKLPPYLSLLCIIVGVTWLFLLPLDKYSRQTYISENALLPGQVHTYFGGSDQHVFRAYKHELNALADKENGEANDGLSAILVSLGLRVGRQNYTYAAAGTVHAGQNIYAILQAPRGDATEALVLVASWRNAKEKLNKQGVALVLTLARYFRRWSLWSKDIIFLVAADSFAGPQAWVDAYHDAHDGSRVQSLPFKSGALQGAVALDYGLVGDGDGFDSVHIVYDGVNGQLPNLDLINSVHSIAGGQMGMGVALQDMWDQGVRYEDRLRTMLRGMLKQGLGTASGPHSAFIPYHVDALTLQPFGKGWQDEMAMGRVVEGTFRSLNNLLEHLHQSFFFYLLMGKDRFVSIGTYLPSAMLVAANFSIMAITLWLKSGHPEVAAAVKTGAKKDGTAVEQLIHVTVERDLFLPMGLVIASQFLGLLPLCLFYRLPESLLAPTFFLFTLLNLLLPLGISSLLHKLYAPTNQQYLLLSCFSLLLLGMFLSSLATLNFSLALLVGLLATPLTFARPSPDSVWRRTVQSVLLQVVAPTSVLVWVWAWTRCSGGGVSIRAVLGAASFGWEVWGMYTSLVVWCVWWPAWLVGSVVVLARRSRSSLAAAGENKA